MSVNVFPCCWKRGFIIFRGVRQERSNFGAKSCLDDFPLPLVALSVPWDGRILCPIIKWPSDTAPVVEGCSVLITISFPLYVAYAFILSSDSWSCFLLFIVGSVRHSIPSILMASTFDGNPGLKTLVSFPLEASSLHPVPVNTLKLGSSQYFQVPGL